VRLTQMLMFAAATFTTAVWLGERLLVGSAGAAWLIATFAALLIGIANTGKA
jgi:hypothetical protein